MNTKLINGVRYQMTQAEIDARAAEEASYTPPVPQTATKAQIRIAIKRAGRLADLAAYVQGLGANSEERILLEEESVITRDGTIANLIQTELSLSDAQMDQLFTVANTIN